MNTIYQIIEDSELLNAVHYKCKDFTIHICFPKRNSFREQIAIHEFWQNFDRLSANTALNR